MVRSSPSFVIVFTECGTQVAAVFHGYCSHCNTSVWYSFKESSSGERIYFKPSAGNAPYFQYSRETFFSKSYLRDVSHNITFSGASFKSRAEVYLANHHENDCELLEKLLEFGRKTNNKDCWKLTENVVGNAWFVWSIINLYEKYGMLDKISIPCNYTSGNHRDLELICRECWMFVQKQPNEWIKHSCQVKGCAEGYITIDDNCKLWRPICAARGGLVDPGGQFPQVRQCCTNMPILGNQSQEVSKFCYEHNENDDNNMNMTSEQNEISNDPVGEDMEGMESSATNTRDQIADENIDIHDIGCKKKENIHKYYDTTAGMLPLIRPCGIIVNMVEMFTCESLTQVLIFILQTFCKESQTTDYFMRLKYLGYDRACQLHPFLINQSEKGNAGPNCLSTMFIFRWIHSIARSTPNRHACLLIIQTASTTLACHSSQKFTEPIPIHVSKVSSILTCINMQHGKWRSIREACFST